MQSGGIRFVQAPLVGLDPAAVVALVGALIATGVFAGLVAGLLGVGGGIVSVPVLFYLFEFVGVADTVRMHLAVGTSLALIVPTTLSSAVAHHARGAVDVGVLFGWGPPMAAGVVVGTCVAGMVPGSALTVTFAGVALVVATTLVLGRPDGLFGTTLPRSPLKDLIAGGIGMISVMVGVGGGALSVPTLAAFGYPIHRAIGTAAATSLLVAIPGTLGFAWLGLDSAGRTAFCLGFVHLPALLFMLPTAMAAAPHGVRLAHAFAAERLRVVFAAFLVLTAGRMLYDLGS